MIRITFTGARHKTYPYNNIIIYRYLCIVSRPGQYSDFAEQKSEEDVTVTIKRACIRGVYMKFRCWWLLLNGVCVALQRVRTVPRKVNISAEFATFSCNFQNRRNKKKNKRNTTVLGDVEKNYSDHIYSIVFWIA